LCNNSGNWLFLRNPFDCFYQHLSALKSINKEKVPFTRYSRSCPRSGLCL